MMLAKLLQLRGYHPHYADRWQRIAHRLKDCTSDFTPHFSTDPKRILERLTQAGYPQHQQKRPLDASPSSRTRKAFAKRTVH